MPGSGLDHRLDVDVVGWPAIDQPAGRVADHRHVRVLDRLDDPGRDPVAGLVLAVVEAGHHPVGPGEHLVGQVEASLLEHVDLDPLEHRDRGLGRRPPSDSLSRSIASHCFSSRLRSSPWAIVTRWPWSVIAM